MVDLDSVAATTANTGSSVTFEDLLPPTFIGRTAANLSAIG